MDLESTVHLCSRTIVELDCKKSKERGMRTEVMIEPMECASQVSHTTSEGRNVHAPFTTKQSLTPRSKKNTILVLVSFFQFPYAHLDLRLRALSYQVCYVAHVKDEQTSKRSEVTTLLHQLFPIHTSTFTLSSLHAHYSLPPSPPSTLPRLFLDSSSTLSRPRRTTPISTSLFLPSVLSKTS